MSLEILTPALTVKLPLSSFVVAVSAGFPSPADDHIDKNLDLNEHLIKHPAATFYVRVSGDSMINAGIHDGDLLIVDKSLKAKDGSVVVAILNGEFTVKRLRLSKFGISLVAENNSYPEIHIKEGMDFEVWGVVTNVIHKVG
jgi:DNA polymerase V